MATDSAYTAFVDKYELLTGVPPGYTFDAPVNADGTPVLPPYTVIIDEGTTPNYDTEHLIDEVTEVLVLVYSTTLALVNTAVSRIKYNGGGVSDGLGMDFGTLPTLTLPGNTLMEVRRVSEKRFMATATGNVAQRIFGCEMRYRVAVYKI